MHAFEASRLAAVWERGQAQHPLHRALTLLQAVEPERAIDELASLPVGERDRRLLQLRRQWFGDRFEAVAACSRCGEKLELSFSAGELPAAPAPPRSPSDAPRLPNTSDLLAVATECPERRVSALLERCAGRALSAAEAEEAQRQMASADPMAHVELQLTCPACSHGWAALFDVASFLWTELSDQVLRIFREVHTLARAYGWSESEILAMSARRRRVYLDLLAGG